MMDEYNFENGVKIQLNGEENQDVEKSIYNMLSKLKKENIFNEYSLFTKDMNLLIRELDRHKLIDENDCVNNIIDVFETVSKLKEHKVFVDNLTDNDAELICAMFLGLYNNEN